MDKMIEGGHPTRNQAQKEDVKNKKQYMYNYLYIFFFKKYCTLRMILNPTLGELLSAYFIESLQGGMEKARE